MKGRHHLAGKVTHPHYFSDRTLNPEQLIPNRTTNHANVRRTIRVFLREDRALIHVPTFDIEVLGRNATVGGMPILIAVDHLHWIVHIRRNTLDKRNLVLDRNSIGHHQRARIMRARAHSVHRSASSFDPNEVVSEVVQLLLDSRLSRVANCHDTDDRRNPDGDSQNRQDASHLVSEQRNQGGSKKSSVVHCSDRSLAPGSPKRFMIRLQFGRRVERSCCDRAAPGHEERERTNTILLLST